MGLLIISPIYGIIVKVFCTRSLMDRTKASDAFDAGSIPVGCIEHSR